MKKGGFFLIGLCFISLIFFGAVRAEEVATSEVQKNYEVFDLGEIFVTSEKPPAVQEMVITNEVTAEDIKATNSRTVAEALSYVPGIRVSTGRKDFPSVQIHGIDQNRFLVLIDGVPYYETKYGGLDLSQIPVDNVAKIEVTKGAASVLYGANALIGVVNIITKKPTEKLAAEGIVEMGNGGYTRVSLSHGMKVGILNYWLNFGHRERDDWRMSDEFDPVIGSVRYRPGPTKNIILEDGRNRANSDYDTNSFWAKVGIDPNPGSEYYVNFHYITKEKGDPPSLSGGQVSTTFPAFSNVFDRITKYNDWGFDLSGQQKVFDQLTLKGKLFYHNHVDDYTSYYDQSYEEEISVSRYKDYILGGSLIGDFRPIEWDTIRFSFNYKGDSHKQRSDEILPFQESFSYTGSVGLENEFNWVKNLSVVAGASYDWYDVTKAQKVTTTVPFILSDADKPDPMNAFNPMIGANYNLFETTRFFGSVARKVRFPTLDQLYQTVSGQLVINDLKPERAINYTLGVSQLFSRYAKAELAGFYHDLKDFITRDSDPRINPDARYQNFGKIRFMGFELYGEVYPLKDLVLYAEYTYNNARDKSPDRVTNKVRNVPEHKVDLGAHYTIPYINTRIDLVGTYLSKVYSQLPTPRTPTSAVTEVDDNFITNFRISTRFLRYLEAYLAVNNIFDKNYESESNFPGPGRNFYLGVSAKY